MAERDGFRHLLGEAGLNDPLPNIGGLRHVISEGLRIDGALGSVEVALVRGFGWFFHDAACLTYPRADCKLWITLARAGQKPMRPLA
jgi:hypothetical protein